MLIGCVLLLVFCVSKRPTVQTEGLEEVLIFGEEESNISTEPVMPEPTAVVISPPVVEEVIIPPISEEIILPPISEEFVLPPITEEITMAPIPAPTLIEEAAAPPALVEILPPIPAAPTPVMPAYTPAPAPKPASVPPPASVFGFRVQIFASSTEKNASRVANDARSAFNEVYIEYVAPYYKVRVGNCLTRDDADMLKSKAAGMGYRGAFVVETKIVP